MKEEANPKNFDPLVEARASPLAKAVYPMFLFFLSVLLAIFVFEGIKDQAFKVFLVGLNLLAALYQLRESYRRYMLQYWFRQLVFTNEKHKKHMEDGSFQTCTCKDQMKEYFSECEKHS